MKVFSNINNELIELSEVSILIEDKNDLMKLQQFLDYCNKKIDENLLFHEHLNDFLNDSNTMPTSNIIIVHQVK